MESPSWARPDLLAVVPPELRADADEESLGVSAAAPRLRDTIVQHTLANPAHGQALRQIYTALCTGGAGAVLLGELAAQAETLPRLSAVDQPQQQQQHLVQALSVQELGVRLTSGSVSGAIAGVVDDLGPLTFCTVQGAATMQLLLDPAVASSIADVHIQLTRPCKVDTTITAELGQVSSVRLVMPRGSQDAVIQLHRSPRHAASAADGTVLRLMIEQPEWAKLGIWRCKPRRFLPAAGEVPLQGERGMLACYVAGCWAVASAREQARTGVLAALKLAVVHAFMPAAMCAAAILLSMHAREQEARLAPGLLAAVRQALSGQRVAWQTAWADAPAASAVSAVPAATALLQAMAAVPDWPAAAHLPWCGPWMLSAHALALVLSCHVVAGDDAAALRAAVLALLPDCLEAAASGRLPPAEHPAAPAADAGDVVVPGAWLCMSRALFAFFEPVAAAVGVSWPQGMGTSRYAPSPAATLVRVMLEHRHALPELGALVDQHAAAMLRAAPAGWLLPDDVPPLPIQVMRADDIPLPPASPAALKAWASGPGIQCAVKAVRLLAAQYDQAPARALLVAVVAHAVGTPQLVQARAGPAAAAGWLPLSPHLALWWACLLQELTPSLDCSQPHQDSPAPLVEALLIAARCCRRNCAVPLLCGPALVACVERLAQQLEAGPEFNETHLDPQPSCVVMAGSNGSRIAVPLHAAQPWLWCCQAAATCLTGSCTSLCAGPVLSAPEVQAQRWLGLPPLCAGLAPAAASSSVRAELSDMLAQCAGLSHPAVEQAWEALWPENASLDLEGIVQRVPAPWLAVRVEDVEGMCSATAPLVPWVMSCLKFNRVAQRKRPPLPAHEPLLLAALLRHAGPWLAQEATLAAAALERGTAPPAVSDSMQLVARAVDLLRVKVASAFPRTEDRAAAADRMCEYARLALQCLPAVPAEAGLPSSSSPQPGFVPRPLAASAEPGQAGAASADALALQESLAALELAASQGADTSAAELAVSAVAVGATRDFLRAPIEGFADGPPDFGEDVLAGAAQLQTQLAMQTGEQAEQSLPQRAQALTAALQHCQWRAYCRGLGLAGFARCIWALSRAGLFRAQGAVCAALRIAVRGGTLFLPAYVSSAGITDPVGERPSGSDAGSAGRDRLEGGSVDGRADADSHGTAELDDAFVPMSLHDAVYGVPAGAQAARAAQAAPLSEVVAALSRLSKAAVSAALAASSPAAWPAHTRAGVLACSPRVLELLHACTAQAMRAVMSVVRAAWDITHRGLCHGEHASLTPSEHVVSAVHHALRAWELDFQPSDAAWLGECEVLPVLMSMVQLSVLPAWASGAQAWLQCAASRREVYVPWLRDEAVLAAVASGELPGDVVSAAIHVEAIHGVSERSKSAAQVMSAMAVGIRERAGAAVDSESAAVGVPIGALVAGVRTLAYGQARQQDQPTDSASIMEVLAARAGAWSLLRRMLQFAVESSLPGLPDGSEAAAGAGAGQLRPGFSSPGAAVAAAAEFHTDVLQRAARQLEIACSALGVRTAQGAALVELPAGHGEPSSLSCARAVIDWCQALLPVALQNAAALAQSGVLRVLACAGAHALQSAHASLPFAVLQQLFKLLVAVLSRADPADRAGSAALDAVARTFAEYPALRALGSAGMFDAQLVPSDGRHACAAVLAPVLARSADACGGSSWRSGEPVLLQESALYASVAMDLAGCAAWRAQFEALAMQAWAALRGLVEQAAAEKTVVSWAWVKHLACEAKHAALRVLVGTLRVIGGAPWLRCPLPGDAVTVGGNASARLVATEPPALVRAALLLGFSAPARASLEAGDSSRALPSGLPQWGPLPGQFVVQFSEGDVRSLAVGEVCLAPAPSIISTQPLDDPLPSELLDMLCVGARMPSVAPEQASEFVPGSAELEWCALLSTVRSAALGALALMAERGWVSPSATAHNLSAWMRLAVQPLDGAGAHSLAVGIARRQLLAQELCKPPALFLRHAELAGDSWVALPPRGAVTTALESLRSGTHAAAGERVDAGLPRDVPSALLGAASSLASSMGMPMELCERVLELCSGHQASAAEWLRQHGELYLPRYKHHLRESIARQTSFAAVAQGALGSTLATLAAASALSEQLGSSSGSFAQLVQQAASGSWPGQAGGPDAEAPASGMPDGPELLTPRLAGQTWLLGSLDEHGRLAWMPPFRRSVDMQFTTSVVGRCVAWALPAAAGACAPLEAEVLQLLDVRSAGLQQLPWSFDVNHVAAFVHAGFDAMGVAVLVPTAVALRPGAPADHAVWPLVCARAAGTKPFAYSAAVAAALAVDDQLATLLARRVLVQQCVALPSEWWAERVAGEAGVAARDEACVQLGDVMLVLRLMQASASVDSEVEHAGSDDGRTGGEQELVARARTQRAVRAQHSLKSKAAPDAAAWDVGGTWPLEIDPGFQADMRAALPAVVRVIIAALNHGAGGQDAAAQRVRLAAVRAYKLASMQAAQAAQAEAMRLAGQQQWGCTACTYLNEPEAEQCEMCDAAPPSLQTRAGFVIASVPPAAQAQVQAAATQLRELGISPDDLAAEAGNPFTSEAPPATRWLVKEVLRNVLSGGHSLAQADSALAASGAPVVLETLHPLPAYVNYSVKRTFPGAAYVALLFDPQCAMPADGAREALGAGTFTSKPLRRALSYCSVQAAAPRQVITPVALQGSGVQLHAEDVPMHGCAVLHASAMLRAAQRAPAAGSPRAAHPLTHLPALLVEGDTVQWNIVCGAHVPASGAAVHAEHWGVRVVAVPLSASTWSTERQVLTSSNFQFGRWLLQLLLGSLQLANALSALHTPDVYAALVRALQAPARPDRRAIVRVLLQLLRTLDSAPSLGPSTQALSAFLSRTRYDLWGALRAPLGRALSSQDTAVMQPGMLVLVELATMLQRGALAVRCPGPVQPLAAEIVEDPTVLANAAVQLEPAAQLHDDAPGALLQLYGLAVALAQQRRVLDSDMTEALLRMARNINGDLPEQYRAPGAELPVLDSALRQALLEQARLPADASATVLAWIRRTLQAQDAQLAALQLGTAEFDDTALAGRGRQPLAALRARAVLLRMLNVRARRLLRLVAWSRAGSQAGHGQPALPVQVVAPPDVPIVARESKLATFAHAASELGLSSHATAARSSGVEALDLGSSAMPTLGAAMAQASQLILESTKADALREAILANQAPDSARLQGYVRVHSGQARLSQAQGKLSPGESRCFFVQLALALRAHCRLPMPAMDSPLLPPELPMGGISEAEFAALLAPLRVQQHQHHKNLFDVKLQDFNAQGHTVDQRGIDWGGLFNETLTLAAGDLFAADRVKLWLPATRASARLGQRGTWVPDPTARDPLSIALWEMVGVLLGMALRTQRQLVWPAAPIFWRLLLGEPATMQDLQGIDEPFVLRVRKRVAAAEAADWDALGATATWTCPGLTGLSVSLPRPPGVPCKGAVAQKAAHVITHAVVSTAFRLSELEGVVAAIRRGLHALVPASSLAAFSWQQLSSLVCGATTVDVGRLQRHAKYVCGWHAEHPAVRMLWSVLESFTDAQRVQFLQFTWGRQRLPPPGQWPPGVQFKLAPLRGMTVTERSLMIAATCEFAVSIPEYPSATVMKERILFALGATEYGTFDRA